jgi:hypothetical protein
MLLRCTAKLLTLLRVRDLATAPPGPDDWYANLLWLDGRKCLLLAHAATLFPVFAANVRTALLRPLGAWLTATIGDQLRAERIPPDTLGVLDPDQVSIAKTARRHVLGVMNDMAQYAQAVVDTSGGLTACDLERLNHRLRRGLHQRDGQYVTPLDLVAERLR